MSGLDKQPQVTRDVPKIGFRYQLPSSSTAPPTLLDLATLTKANNYDFLLAPIAPPLTESRLCGLKEEVKKPSWCLKMKELFINQADFSGYVIGSTSANIVMDQSTDDLLTYTALFRKEIEWASHIGLKSIFLPPITSTSEDQSLVNYARVINQVIASNQSYLQYVVPIHLNYQNVGNQVWKKWNLFRSVCSHRASIKIALVLPSEQEPVEFPLYDQFVQWFGESVMYVIVPTELFLANAKGYPVLAKATQKAFKAMFQYNPQWIVSSLVWNTTLPQHTCKGEPDIGAYMGYVQHLSKQSQPISAIAASLQEEFDAFAHGYHDYLQAPLQPLMDQLESATYEVFEKDPVKYQLYEHAVYKALVDLGKRDTPVVIIVAGAGRGPLVDRCLKASASAKLPIKLYAVEKNPNAFVTLQLRKENDWHDKVDIVFTDMRRWNAPEKADILVTELLGSFGDNELSPECLDGAQKFLKPDGIFIPKNYTSYIAPITSTKLYEAVAAYNDATKFEIPYVVMFQQIRLLAEPIKTWSFHHPLPGTYDCNIDNSHNERFSTANFEFTNNTEGIIHGLAGYFESTLYDDIIMSIHPTTHSPGMFSWFPLFFPLQSPIHVTPNSKLSVNLWRCSSSSSRKVWYEWCVVPTHSSSSTTSSNLVVSHSNSVIHNPNGRSYWIGL